MDTPIKNNARHLAVFLMTAVFALSICGCRSQGPSHAETVVNKLSRNAVLKTGWVKLPVPILISNSVPEKFRAAIIEAMDKWNTEAGIAVFKYAGETIDIIPKHDDMNVIYWDETNTPNGHFGVTNTITFNKNVIVESDVVFFDDPNGFDVLTCGNGKKVCRSNLNKKDVTTTALHELGHVLGFVHSNGPTDIMNPNFRPGDVRHGFDNRVIAELKEVYESAVVADAR